MVQISPLVFVASTLAVLAPLASARIEHQPRHNHNHVARAPADADLSAYSFANINMAALGQAIAKNEDERAYAMKLVATPRQQDIAAARKAAAAKKAAKKAASAAKASAAAAEASAAAETDRAAKIAKKERIAQAKAQRAAKAAAEQAAADEAAAQKAAAEKEAADKAQEEKVFVQAAVQPKPEKTQSSNIQANGRGLLGYSSDNCGSSRASDNEPNGSLDFLNCGISRSNPSSGWNPPSGITLDHLAFVSIESALASNSVWQPCAQWIPLFEKHGASTGIPPIMLAAIALQESTCNKDVIGGGGENGLMQITDDKCGGRSKAGCMEPDYNIGTAARYLKGEIDNAGGNVLRALGQYNGWQPGMSFNSATAAQYSGCCRCQNNLDYLYQMLNGWLLGKTGYSMKTYNNLAVCD